eukprot:7630524-Alexandrium_andersonii.AAC.1
MGAAKQGAKERPYSPQHPGCGCCGVHGIGYVLKSHGPPCACLPTGTVLRARAHLQDNSTYCDLLKICKNAPAPILRRLAPA